MPRGRYAAGEARREEAYAKELKRQKELWASAEKAKREAWLADKTKEIKDATVRGLEPDIQRLVGRHREEARKLEESLREQHKTYARMDARNAWPHGPHGPMDRMAPWTAWSHGPHGPMDRMGASPSH